ncbi:MAG: endonuclease Q family protein [Promethearchaeota archaeon]
MEYFDTDLHIHSPHSIAVSKNLNLDTMVNTCKKKGLKILGTGDITQPDWRKYLKNNLEYKNGIYSYKDTFFIIQTELEDEESIHHVVLLPDIETGELLQKKISSKTKNITGNYAGRPHVHMSPAEIADLVDDIGGISGPAHAFTPFKAIFRQGKFDTLEQAYGSAVKKIYFLELGLSADTNVADRMACLKNVTFLSNSDAHSEGVQSLGREFNRFFIEKPSFEEIEMAIRRKNGRKITLNVGMEPRLGKYPMMFCRVCRKRIRLFLKTQDSSKIMALKKLPKTKTLTMEYSMDDSFIYYFFNSENQRTAFKHDIGLGKVKCPSCAKSSKPKSSKILLGVFDRVDEISDYLEPKHPQHRPPYIGIVPIVEMLRAIKGLKNVKAKSVINEYDRIIERFGNEFKILTDDRTLEKLKNSGGYNKLADLISAFRAKEIEFVPGGGGKYGKIKLDEL